jgi:hypothetical protein
VYLSGIKEKNWSGALCSLQPHHYIPGPWALVYTYTVTPTGIFSFLTLKFNFHYAEFSVTFFRITFLGELTYPAHKTQIGWMYIMVRSFPTIGA